LLRKRHRRSASLDSRWREGITSLQKASKSSLAPFPRGRGRRLPRRFAHVEIEAGSGSPQGRASLFLLEGVSALRSTRTWGLRLGPGTDRESRLVSWRKRSVRVSTRFATTNWSLVLAAAARSDTPTSCQALASLCETYWYPLYAFVRRQGYNQEEAGDLTQSYFLRLLEKDYLKSINPEAGRFRSFLLASLRHFLANEWDRAHALKRAPMATPIPLDLQTAERRYSVEPAHGSTPEKVFEQQWALAVLEKTLARLGGELAEEGKEARFERLKPYLTGEEPSLPYSRVAADLDMSEGAVKAVVHRMRRRFGRLLREEIAATVAQPEDVEGEIRYLLTVIGEA
jgi:RNA polymerase sigma factor (sigma-70 family)